MGSDVSVWMGGEVVNDGNVCWWCRGELIWDSDYDIEWLSGDELTLGVITTLHCRDCGAKVTYETGEED